MDAATPLPKREVWSPVDKKIIKFLKFNPVMYVESRHPADIQSADNLWNVLAAGTEISVTDLQNRWEIIKEKCQQWVNNVLESELSKEDEEIIDCLLVIYGQITKLKESRNKKESVVFSTPDMYSSGESLDSQPEDKNEISNNDDGSMIEPMPSTSKSLIQNYDVEEEDVDETTNESKNDDNNVPKMEDENQNSEEESRDIICDEDMKFCDEAPDGESVNLNIASDHSNLKEAKEQLFDEKGKPATKNACDMTADLPEVQEDTTIFFEKLGVFIDKELSAKKQREVRLKIWSMITNAELEMLSDEK